MWLKLHLTPKRDYFEKNKQNRLDYQPLFGKARAVEPEPQTEIRAFFVIVSSSAP